MDGERTGGSEEGMKCVDRAYDIQRQMTNVMGRSLRLACLAVNADERCTHFSSEQAGITTQRKSCCYLEQLLVPRHDNSQAI